jgi:uncharacterized membrane protein YecN with MAPEG domain
MHLTTIPVTLTFAAAVALINLWLQIRVGRVRGSEKVSIGDGGNELVLRRMRAQANLVENAPFAGLLVLALELTCGTGPLLWSTAALFVIGRLVHPFGMDGMKYGRTIGTALSMLTLLFLSGWAVWAVYHGCSPVGAATVVAPVAG